eukprot:g9367.t1
MLSDEVNHLLDECKEFPLYQEGDLHTHGDQETLSKLQAWAPGHLQLLWEMIPKVMVFCSTLLYCLVMRYYTLHCVQVDGKWVSKAGLFGRLFALFSNAALFSSRTCTCRAP